MAKGFLGRHVMVCEACGDVYHVTARRAATAKPYVCRTNGCHRVSFERPGDEEMPGTARGTKVPIVSGVAGVRFEAGRGKRRHDLAPLANGRVRRSTYAACVGGVSADE